MKILNGRPWYEMEGPIDRTEGHRKETRLEETTFGKKLTIIAPE